MRPLSCQLLQQNYQRLFVNKLRVFFLRFYSHVVLEDSTDQEFPIPNINGKTLALVVRFLNHYQEEAMTKITKVT